MWRKLRNHISDSWLCLLVVVVLQACNMANLDLHPVETIYKGQLVVEYDWSNAEKDEQIPDSMIVWAVRPVFRNKTASNWASRVAPGEDRLYGRNIAPYDNLYHAPHSDGSGRDSIFLTPGEWIVSSYSSTDASIQVVTDFVNDSGGVDEEDLLIYRKNVFDKLPERYYYWYDRNPYSIWTNAGPRQALFLGRDTIFVNDTAMPDSLYKANITPEFAEQVVTITFEAEVLDQDIQVDSIVCAVSGVIVGMNLNNMELDASRTYQAIFHTDLAYTEDGYVSASGQVFVPGILRSASSSMLQGPGLLAVSVFVSYDAEDGERKYRRLDGTANLYHPLTENPSVLYNDEDMVMQTQPELNLYIRSRMQISKDRLSSAHDAITPWEDATEFEVELN